MRAESRSANDGGVGSYRSALFYERAAIFMFPFDWTARINDIGEDHRWAAKDVVFEFNSGIDRYIILNLDAIADSHARTDHNVLSEIAVPAYLRSGHYMGEVPDFGSCADVAIRIDDG